ncbi:MAG: PilZ domain-containing protein [Thermodesulfovibrionales bacterium]
MRDSKQEKRRQKRFAKRCTAEFTSDGQTHSGLCKNLSFDGLFIKTRKPFDLNKIIEMTVHLPDGSTSKLTGRVTRAMKDRHSAILERAGLPSKDGMGIQLIEKDANYLNFVTSLIPKPEA